MNQPFLAAQCPFCKNWIRTIGEPERFIDHQVQVEFGEPPTTCQGSGMIATDSPHETMDKHMLARDLP